MKYCTILIILLLSGTSDVAGMKCCKRVSRPDSETAPLVALVPTALGKKEFRVDKVCSGSLSTAVSAVAYGAAAFADYAVTSQTIDDPQAACIAQGTAKALRVFSGLALLRAIYDFVVSSCCIPDRVTCCCGRCHVKLS